MENICYFLWILLVIKEDTFARIKGKHILLTKWADLISESSKKCENYPLYMYDKKKKNKIIQTLLNKGNNKITELRTILQGESQNS